MLPLDPVRRANFDPARRSLSNLAWSLFRDIDRTLEYGENAGPTNCRQIPAKEGCIQQVQVLPISRLFGLLHVILPW